MRDARARAVSTASHDDADELSTASHDGHELTTALRDALPGFQRGRALRTTCAFAFLSLCVLGCQLDASTKTACTTQADCLDGFVCSAGSCTSGTSTARDAGYTEAHFPLAFILPRAPDADAGLTSAHRVFRAYPGLRYEVRAVVEGGAYPYEFTLSNAPDGMSVDSRTGLVRWENPQAAASPTLLVRDAQGTELATTWSIAVSTSGFRFVDAVNGQSSAAGTMAAPWRTLADVQTNGAIDDLVYFRTGTYDLIGAARSAVGTSWERVVFNARQGPVAFLAFPDEAPVLDLAGGALLRFAGGSPWVDGFETRNAGVIALQLEGGTFAVLRRLTMRGLMGGPDGSSASFVHVLDWMTPLRGFAVQDCEFSDSTQGDGVLISSRTGAVIEDNRFLRLTRGVSLKRQLYGFSVRNNDFDAAINALGGETNARSTGELLFNRVRNASTHALSLNEGGDAASLFVFRNTLVGRVRVRLVSATSGPVAFTRNVVVNDDRTTTPPHFFFDQVTAPERVVFGDNLTGPIGGGLVDDQGALLPAQAAQIGQFGHQR